MFLIWNWSKALYVWNNEDSAIRNWYFTNSLTLNLVYEKLVIVKHLKNIVISEV